MFYHIRTKLLCFHRSEFVFWYFFAYTCICAYCRCVLIAWTWCLAVGGTQVIYIYYGTSLPYLTVDGWIWDMLKPFLNKKRKARTAFLYGVAQV